MARALTRRGFLGLAASAVPALCVAQSSVTHANVAELDRSNILLQARAALAEAVSSPLAPSLHTEVNSGSIVSSPSSSTGNLDRRAAGRLQSFSATVSALTAGFLVTQDTSFARAAVAHLTPWLISPATRLEPAFDRAGCLAGTETATPAGVVDLLPLAELARALAFLTDVLSPADFEQIRTWFAAAAIWLENNKQAMIAREAKDHRASAYLLLRSAVARLLRDDDALEDARKRFRGATLRHQVRADGLFPQEVATGAPYRNTLLNFDLLAGACQLLHTPFAPLWPFELIDGLGMRVVSAALFPVIAHPEQWRYPADLTDFRLLPGRRPGLLFSGRAFDRPEYVQTWLDTTPAIPPEVADSFPIRQPSLWTARAAHGL